MNRENTQGRLKREMEPIADEKSETELCRSHIKRMSLIIAQNKGIRKTFQSKINKREKLQKA